MNALARIPHGANPQSELARAMALHGAARKEHLNKLSERHPDYAPIWVALAEEHLASRRREEALYAARRALRIDPNCEQRFSPALTQATAHLVPKRSSEPAKSNHVIAMRQGRVPTPTLELTRAKSLHGAARREQLIELTHRFPNHAPTWLALAEENLAQRRPSRAMAALERTLHLDPGLEQLMSPRLEQARRYHKKESHGHKAPSPRTEDVTRRAHFKPRPWQPQAPAMHSAPPMHEPAPAASSPRVDQMLARTLEISDPAERLAMLRELWKIAPDHDGVLFHVAIESALAGHTDDARRAGRSLQRVSPRRYAELYAIAETWSTDAGAFQPNLAQPAHNIPAHLARQQASANARTMCLQVPSPQSTPPSVSHPVMQLQAFGGPAPQKTQILSIPLPPAAARVAPVAPIAAFPAPPPHKPARRSRAWRTVGALTAGIAAGLLVAALLVFVLGRTQTLPRASEPVPSMEQPSLVQTEAQKAQDVDPMFMLTP